MYMDIQLNTIEQEGTRNTAYPNQGEGGSACEKTLTQCNQHRTDNQTRTQDGNETNIKHEHETV